MSRWNDIPGFSWSSPSSGLLVKEAMRNLINASHERLYGDQKNESSNYSEAQLNDLHYMLPIILNKIEGAAGFYLNLNYTDGMTPTGELSFSPSWRSNSSDLSAPQMASNVWDEMGLYLGEDLSYLRDRDSGVYLSPDLLRQLYLVIGAMKYKFGEIGQTSINLSTSRKDRAYLESNYSTKLSGLSDSLAPTQYIGQGTGFSSSGSLHATDSYNVNVGSQYWQSDVVYLHNIPFTTGMDVKVFFHVLSQYIFYDFGMPYQDNTIYIRSANEQPTHYSFPFIVSNSEFSNFLTYLDSASGTSGFRSLDGQFCFNIDNATFLEYYTP